MPLLAAAAATHGSRPHGEHATCDLLQASQPARSDIGLRLLGCCSAVVVGFFFPILTRHLSSRWEAGQAESTFRVREGLRDPYCLHPSNFHPTRLLPYLTDTVLSLKASSSRRFLRRERTEPTVEKAKTQ